MLVLDWVQGLDVFNPDLSVLVFFLIYGVTYFIVRTNKKDTIYKSRTQIFSFSIATLASGLMLSAFNYEHIIIDIKDKDHTVISLEESVPVSSVLEKADESDIDSYKYVISYKYHKDKDTYYLYYESVNGDKTISVKVPDRETHDTLLETKTVLSDGETSVSAY